MLAFVILWLLVHALFVYTINPSGTYFSFIKSIIPFPAMVIGGRVITMHEYDQRILSAQNLYTNVYQITSDDGDVMIADNVKKEIIDTILMERALANIGVSVTSGEINREYENIANTIGGRSDVINILKLSANWREDEFKQKLYYDLLKRKVRENILFGVKMEMIVIVSGQELDDGSFVTPEMIQSVYDSINLGVTGFDDAKTLYAYKNTSLQMEGDRYYFIDEVPDSFRNVFFSESYTPHAYELIKTDLGYYIVKAEGTRGYYKGTLDNLIIEQKRLVRTWVFIR